jgi:hypothetical protein
MFVGDYFTLITTVVLEESLRERFEDDHTFASRLASVWLQEHYGWDVKAVSHQIGIVDSDAEEDE